MTLPFAPSHTVPAGGLPAWSNPDPAVPNVADLDPGLPVAVAERRGDWARIICSNGWAGWVDARRLVPIAGPPAVAAGPSPVIPAPAAGAVVQPSVAVASPRRRRRPGCLLILLILVIVVPLAAFGAFRLGLVTPQTLLNLIGQGPGYIEVDNLQDDTITVSVADTSTASDAASPSSGSLNSFDIRTLTAPKAGGYMVSVAGSSGTAIAACTVDLHSGDTFLFVVLPDVTIVHRNNDNVSQGSELNVTTSSLCR